MIKEKTKTGLIWGVAIVLLGLFVWQSGFFTPAEEQAQQTALVQQTAALTTAQLEAASCPDTYLTNVTFNLMNSKNTTASDEIGAQLNVYKVINGVADTNAFTTLANTTNSGVSLPCGEDWMGRVLSSNADHGRNSRVTSATGEASVDIVDGDIYFSTTGSAMTVNGIGSIHGLLEFQVYDEQNRGFLNEDGATASTAYQASPAAFESTTDTTALAVGTAGQVELTTNYRTITTDKDWNDRGGYLTVNASTATWDKPTLRLGGAGGDTLSDVKGSLDQYCARSYSGEEYVYFADRDVPLNDKGQIYFSVFALSGVNPGADDDISLSWRGIGTYTSIEGNNILNVGACNDASTTADVFASQIVSINVS